MWLISLRFVARSWIWALVPLTLALEVPTYFEQRRALVGDWPSAVEVANGAIPIVAILAAVASAGATLPWQRHRIPVTAHAWHARVWDMLPAGICLALVAGTHLAWVVGVLGYESASASGWPAAGPAVAGVLMIAAATAVGSLAATAVRSWLIVPAVGALLYTILVWAQVGSFNNFVTLGGIGLSIVGMEPRPAVIQSQVGFFAALTVASAAAKLALLERSPVLLSSSAVGVVLATVVGVTLYSMGPDRFQRSEIDWSCAGSSPRYCVPTVDSEGLEAGQARLATAFDRWRAASGKDSPALVWQRTAFPDPNHRVEIAAFDGSQANIGFAVVESLHPCIESWGEEQWDAAEALARYIADGDAPLTDDVTEAVRLVAC